MHAPPAPSGATSEDTTLDLDAVHAVPARKHTPAARRASARASPAIASDT